ncbi:ABC transporter ATP-binding protein [[Clostridium] polysaccharolyticum]|nr:ABC transporter ATP-binding protein [[Clostridium] polysaccharolyticum]
MKRYGEHMVIDQLSLEVREGEIYGLLGPVGAGKTVLVQCLLSLISFDKGTVKLFDEKVCKLTNTMKTRIGICFQDNGVFESLTVYDNIYYFAKLYLKEKGKSRQAVEAVLEALDLKEFKKIYYYKLDESRQKLCNFACAIVHNPDLIFVDGGVASCEPKIKYKIYQKLRELRKEGKTIFLTTHFIEEAEEICDRVAIMDRGRIIAHGTKEELKKSISLGERSQFHVYHITEKQMEQVRLIPGVYYVEYENEIMTVKSKRGRNNLLHILKFFHDNEIAIGEIVSELPTLDDVFWELTGKQIIENSDSEKPLRKKMNLFK